MTQCRGCNGTRFRVSDGWQMCTNCGQCWGPDYPTVQERVGNNQWPHGFGKLVPISSMKWHSYPRKGDKEKRLMPKKKTGKIKKQKEPPKWWDKDVLGPWAEDGKRRTNDEDEWREHIADSRHSDTFTVPREKDRTNNIVSYHSKTLDTEESSKKKSKETKTICPTEERLIE